MFIIIIILYVQLATTMTVETFGKMANPMRSLTFFKNMTDHGVREQAPPFSPIARFQHVTIRARTGARGSKNKFSMGIIQSDCGNRSQDTPMLHMTGKTGLFFLMMSAWKPVTAGSDRAAKFALE